VHSHHFTPQQQTHQWDVPFEVPPSEGPLRLFGSFNLALLLLLHAAKPY